MTTYLCRLCEKRCRKKQVIVRPEPGEAEATGERNGSPNLANGDGAGDVKPEDGEPPSKKPRPAGCCPLCLGVLDPDVLDDVVRRSFGLLDELGYEWRSLCFNVTAPVAVLPREAAFRAGPASKEPGRRPPGDLKEAWRALLAERLEAAGRHVVLARNADDDDDPTSVSVSVEYSYDGDAAECGLVRRLDPAFAKKSGKVHGRRYDERALTRTYVQAVLESAAPEDVLRLVPFPGAAVASPAAVSRLELGRPSYWLAGRYLKFSRTLCQTPWFIEGRRKGETSLEEIIQDGIRDVVACDAVRFSSSGREDVDVRCLGRGRPFLCQIANPRRLCRDAATAAAVAAAVNARSASRIAVRDVQFVSKSEAANLKEGEEEKVKRYRALCVTADAVPAEKLAALADMTELVVRQRTPIRVLHRRSLADRDRTVHRMSAEPCPGAGGGGGGRFFFELSLETQAGTYIKEFVHGDLGRTTPNVSTILGVPTDILALDVEAVMLDWPPFLDD